MALAIDGGKPAVSGLLRPYNSIGDSEIAAALAAINSGPLSGFLGGERHGGYYVQSLEEEMCYVFGSKHAVACNSATSGLLIASLACGVGRDTRVSVPAFTMSATAAAPAFLGADLVFCDVEDKTFNVNTIPFCKVAIATNLFGHPAELESIRKFGKYMLIEDNAQGWFAKENGRYAGTIGHIGVFSFNVHKHLQSGEGGICLTDDPELADNMRLYRNHGELAGLSGVGLNLRMTEVDAAIALAQLERGRELVASRVELAEKMTHMVVNYPGLVPPLVREGCDHSYYMWALTVEKDRDWFVRAMNAEGVPLNRGYVSPLYNLPAFERYKSSCPVAEWLHRYALATFEICAYDPTAEQLREMQDAFDKVGEEYARRGRESAA